MDTSTRIIDYDLKCCMVGQKCKNNISGNNMVGGTGVESLSLTFPILYESFLLTSRPFPENEEISVPPPCGFLIGIYKFYENWSTESFRKE